MIKNYKELFDYLCFPTVSPIIKELKLYKAKNENYYFIKFYSVCEEISKKLATELSERYLIDIGIWGQD